MLLTLDHDVWSDVQARLYRCATPLNTYFYFLPKFSNRDFCITRRRTAAIDPPYVGQTSSNFFHHPEDSNGRTNTSLHGIFLFVYLSASTYNRIASDEEQRHFCEEVAAHHFLLYPHSARVWNRRRRRSSSCMTAVRDEGQPLGGCR